MPRYLSSIKKKLSEKRVAKTIFISLKYAIKKISSEFKHVQSAVFVMNTKFQYFINIIRYEHPANPRETIVINPQEVKYTNESISRLRGLGQIRGGDWDKERQQFGEMYIPKGLYERYVKKYKWEDTAYMRRAEELFAEGDNWGGYKDLQQFKDIRCSYVDELYKSMKENGYRPNFKDQHTVPEEDSRHKDSLHKLEPLVVIGREGTILFRDGYHRFTLAKILDIEEIPVHVLARHKQWQRIRDKVAKASSIEELDEDVQQYINHPDLKDLRSSLFE